MQNMLSTPEYLAVHHEAIRSVVGSISHHISGADTAFVTHMQRDKDIFTDCDKRLYDAVDIDFMRMHAMMAGMAAGELTNLFHGQGVVPQDWPEGALPDQLVYRTATTFINGAHVLIENTQTVSERWGISSVHYMRRLGGEVLSKLLIFEHAEAAQDAESAQLVRTSSENVEAGKLIEAVEFFIGIKEPVVCGLVLNLIAGHKHNIEGTCKKVLEHMKDGEQRESARQQLETIREYAVNTLLLKQINPHELAHEPVQAEYDEVIKSLTIIEVDESKTS